MEVKRRITDSKSFYERAPLQPNGANFDKYLAKMEEQGK